MYTYLQNKMIKQQSKANNLTVSVEKAPPLAAPHTLVKFNDKKCFEHKKK